MRKQRAGAMAASVKADLLLVSKHRKSIHVSEDVHRFLRVRAAWKGSSIEAEADRVIREIMIRDADKMPVALPASIPPPAPSGAKRRR